MCGAGGAAAAAAAAAAPLTGELVNKRMCRTCVKRVKVGGDHVGCH